MILAQTLRDIYSSEPVGCGIFELDNCQPEVVSDIISGVVMETVGEKFRVKYGDSKSKRSRDIRLPHFVTNDDNDNDDDDVGRRTLRQ